MPYNNRDKQIRQLMTKQQGNFLDLLSEKLTRLNQVYFTRQDLVTDEQFVSDLTRYVTSSRTPLNQLDYLLQCVRDLGLIEFVDYQGQYKITNQLV